MIFQYMKKNQLKVQKQTHKEVPNYFLMKLNTQLHQKIIIVKVLKTRKKNSRFQRFYVNKNFKTEGKMKDFSSPKNLSHFPVMLEEVLKICNPSKGGNFIDCTFGYGGLHKCNIILSQN